MYKYLRTEREYFKDKFNVDKFIGKCRKLGVDKEIVKKVLVEMIRLNGKITNYWAYSTRLIRKYLDDDVIADSLAKHWGRKEEEKMADTKTILKGLT